MPKRRWKRKPPPSLIPSVAVIVIGTVIAVAGLLLEAKDRYSNDRQYEPGGYASATDGVCLKLPPIISFCPDEQSTAEADAQRSDEDLRAQREMADWAFVVALTSSIGLVFSGAGIGLIYVTFSAAREANGIARESAERQLRAYLVVGSVSVPSFKVGKPMHIRVALTNVGQTPAKRLRVAYSANGGTDHRTVKIRFQRPVEAATISNSEVGPQKNAVIDIVGAFDVTEDALAAVRDRRQYVVVGLVGRYYDVFGKRRLLVMRGFIAFHPDGTIGLAVGEKGNRTN